ncbi:hypothetical protein BRC81_09235 [Halobacteriales archaeon QS_1_68_20]|nr:MAG: hypothetical protein BRC81_09235 [Halobacteriales archaeon QS_1_68_20]
MVDADDLAGAARMVALLMLYSFAVSFVQPRTESPALAVVASFGLVVVVVLAVTGARTLVRGEPPETGPNSLLSGTVGFGALLSIPLVSYLLIEAGVPEIVAIGLALAAVFGALIGYYYFRARRRRAAAAR